MNRILLVFEDYGELMELESSLKRVGFDVIGISSEYSLSEQILSFNPEVVIGSGKGAKVNSIGVGKRLKEMTRWQGKAILLFQQNFKPSPQDLIKIRVDMILESPVPPLRMVQVLAKILGHDEAVLLERLNKAIHVESGAKSPGSGSGASGSAEDDAIYVTGKAPKEEGDASVSGRFSLQDSSEESDVSSENEVANKGMEFRLGERMTSAIPESDSLSSEESGFADVDLKALERELLGGGEPEVERIDVSSTESPVAEEDVFDGGLSSAESTADEDSLAVKTAQDLEPAGDLDTDAASLELRQAELGLAEKIAKYSAMVADVKVSPKSTVSRVEARKRQRQLVADWDGGDLRNQDSLRREFTKALFKK